jgi:hypothetical protein
VESVAQKVLFSKSLGFVSPLPSDCTQFGGMCSEVRVS